MHVEMYTESVDDNDKRPIVALEPEERDALLDYADDECTFRVRFTIRALMHTGMRIAELSHMDETWLEGPDPHADGFEWTDADVWPLIRVPMHKQCACNYCSKQARRNVKRHSKKPSPGDDGFENAVSEALAEYWKPKSSKGSRNIPVFYEDTWKVLWDYFHERNDVGRAYEYPDGRVATEVGVTKHALWQRVNKVDDEMSEDLGFEESLTCHSLRHTFGTMLGEREVPVDNIRKVLGHKNNETTEVYIDITGQQNANQIAGHMGFEKRGDDS